MKKLSLILSGLILLGGMSFAQSTPAAPASKEKKVAVKEKKTAVKEKKVASKEKAAAK
jgi:hypothetical protein